MEVDSDSGSSLEMDGKKKRKKSDGVQDSQKSQEASDKSFI